MSLLDSRHLTHVISHLFQTETPLQGPRLKAEAPLQGMRPDSNAARKPVAVVKKKSDEVEDEKILTGTNKTEGYKDTFPDRTVIWRGKEEFVRMEDNILMTQDPSNGAYICFMGR